MKLLRYPVKASEYEKAKNYAKCNLNNHGDRLINKLGFVQKISTNVTLYR